MPKRMITRGRSRPRTRLGGSTQREVICDVMLSAAQRSAWLTLRELARLTKYGEASISAQLRHLRKPRYGAFVVEKRPRDGETSACLVHASPVWEYQIRKRQLGRRSRKKQPARPRGATRAEA